MKQVSIMFTVAAAAAINAQCQAPNVSALDSQNQRVFDNVVSLEESGNFLHVTLKNGNMYSYPCRNIERISCKPCEQAEQRACEEMDALVDQMFGTLLEQAALTAEQKGLTAEQLETVNQSVDDVCSEERQLTDYEVGLLDGVDAEDTAALIEEFAAIDARYNQ